MKTFTYGQYLKYIHTVRLNAVLQLAEESQEYNIQEKNKKEKQKENIMEILKNTKEVAQIINKFLLPKKIIETDELIPYSNTYICNKYKEKEKPILYQRKKENTIFLIEHDLISNKEICYKILNDCVIVMQGWIRDKKQEKVKGYPIIVPILLKLDENNLNEKNNMNLEYNIIKIKIN